MTRLHDHLDAVVALEAQLGEPDFTFNLDGNLGVAVNF